MQVSVENWTLTWKGTVISIAFFLWLVPILAEYLVSGYCSVLIVTFHFSAVLCPVLLAVLLG